jgi:hypothetical protein
LTKGLRKGFWILADVSGKKLFGITGTLSDPNDSSGGVAFENGAILGESEFARSILRGLPIRVICTTLDVVNHLAIELEWNSELDKGFNFALLRGHTISGPLDRALVTRAYGRQCGARRTVNIRNASTGEIPLDCA